jgi:osmotically inducible lipoprotein OsmB
LVKNNSSRQKQRRSNFEFVPEYSIQAKSGHRPCCQLRFLHSTESVHALMSEAAFRFLSGAALASDFRSTGPGKREPLMKRNLLRSRGPDRTPRQPDSGSCREIGMFDQIAQFQSHGTGRCSRRRTSKENKIMDLKALLALVFALLSLTFIASCSPTGVGAGVGAGGGALVGEAVGHPVIGALVGGAGGAVVGHEVGEHRNRE